MRETLVNRARVAAELPGLLEQHRSHLEASSRRKKAAERAACDLELMATGALSPLDRFMGAADYEHVLAEMRLVTISKGTFLGQNQETISKLELGRQWPSVPRQEAPMAKRKRTPPTLWEVPDELWQRIEPLLKRLDPPAWTGRQRVDRRR